ncbi:MAG: hypothetical protein H7203_08625 [Rhizobacter sp.]|nr:hypothetical protein [Burkholderiales bacterium]
MRIALLGAITSLLLAGCAGNPQHISVASSVSTITPTFKLIDLRPDIEKHSDRSGSGGMEERTLGDDAISPSAVALLERELARQGNPSLAGKDLTLVSLLVTANVIAPSVQPLYGAAALGPGGVVVGSAVGYALQWAGTRPKLSVLAGVQYGGKTLGAFNSVQVSLLSNPRDALESALELTARDLIRAIAN